ELRETEAAHLLEQAARMHVLRHRLREALEARCRALARQRPARLAVMPQCRVGEPACEELGGRGALRRLELLGLDEARDLAAVQSRGRAHAAHRAIGR